MSKIITRDIEVGNGAIMFIPGEGAEWNLRYGNIEITRYQAAAIIASYDYLLHGCTMKEAVRRLRIMRRPDRSGAQEDR